LERFPASPGGVATNPLGGVENAINTVFEPLADVLTAFVFAEITVLGIAFPWIVAWLVVAAAIFTVYFGFVQFRQFRLATRIARGPTPATTNPARSPTSRPSARRCPGPSVWATSPASGSR